MPALPSSEIERLIASVGERGVHALADDATTREVYQRLQVAGPAALARLTEVLRSTQPTLRLGAAALLGLHGGVETARALAEQLEREATPEVRSALLQALAGIESPDGADALLRVWEAPDASEGDRRVALQGLASLGHPAARALLADPRSSAVHRRLAEIGLVRAYRVRGTSDASLRGVLETIAASSSSEASRREAAEALAETAR